jgi:hypothetical protein
MSRIVTFVLPLLVLAGQGFAQESPVLRGGLPAELPEVVAPTTPELPAMVAPAPPRAAAPQATVAPHTQATIQPLPPVPYYHRYERPRDAVHRAAALKAAQRRERIAARKAMGYSPLRPPASPLPFMGGPSSYSIISPPLYYPPLVVGATPRPVVIGRHPELGSY